MEDKKRLKDIIDLVDKNKRVIDVGTDHGLVPLYLAKEKISKDILATDISEKSLGKLENILDDDLRKYIKTKVTDGFLGIESKENQIGIIAGMGANTIIDIIDQSIDFVRKLDYLILASNVNTEKLRTYLNKKGFMIQRDFLSYENSKYYDILKVANGDEPSLSIEEIYYPRDDIRKRTKILEDKLKIDYRKNKDFENQIRLKSKDDQGLLRIKERLKAIEEIYRIWKLEN
ncbi:MAG: tRNA (adenine(22)-N(1))-methyltransferase TrmK [Anaerococcus sp.]|nr:tRNA (adenine(22)-N(1))-methyltransferase TrmK [Anaerococcus sp.]